MIKNYLKVAIRNLFRHKGYALINILGLAVGLAASLLIVCYVADELSFDRFHAKGDRICRLKADWSNKGDSRIHQLGTPYVLAKTIRDKYPQAEAVTQVSGPVDDIILRRGGTALKETEVYAADPSFFDVFTFPLLQGDPKTALAEPNTAVLTEALAAKCFGAEDPLDKIVEVRDSGTWLPLRVAGVVRDVPRRSHFRFSMLVSMRTFYPEPSMDWTSNNYTTYLLLAEGVTRQEMERTLARIENLDMSGGRPHLPWVWTPEPLKRIHLYADLATGNQPNGSIGYVRLFTAIAVLILLISGINFVNLATARSARRAREVGIRKTVGSLRRQILAQFLGESVLLSLAALFVAVVILLAVFPSFRSLTGRVLELPLFRHPLAIPGLVGLAVAVGVLAGLYPAFFLSSFKQAEVLKSSPLSGRRRGPVTLRDGLVVFQFSVSVLLIIGALMIGRQLEFIKNSRLGFDKDNVVVVHNADTLAGGLEAYKNRLLRHPRIRGVALASSIPGRGTPNWGIGVEGVPRERPMNMNFLVCDQDFADVLDLETARGRFFSREHTSDAAAVVLNERAAEYFDLPEPIGKKVTVWWSSNRPLTVVGVIKDFHFESLHRNVRPMGYVLPAALPNRSPGFLLVKAAPAGTTETLAYLQQAWAEVSGGLPFEFSFMDEKIDALYQNDNRAGRIVTLFSLLAVFVSCLGLFGLAAFVAEQRTKEISVRKILGAPVSGLIWLLTGQFVARVAVAVLIAWPVGYWVMSRWLQSFAFRARLSAGIFIASASAALAIVLVTVSSQVIRAASVNPAETLKYE